MLAVFPHLSDPMNMFGRGLGVFCDLEAKKFQTANRAKRRPEREKTPVDCLVWGFSGVGAGNGKPSPKRAI